MLLPAGVRIHADLVRCALERMAVIGSCGSEVTASPSVGVTTAVRAGPSRCLARTDAAMDAQKRSRRPAPSQDRS